MSFAETWQSASVDERPEAPDPGSYDLVLDDAKAFMSKKDEAWVTLSWRVASLRNKDHAWDVLLGFRSQKQANVTKATIAKLGVDVDSVGDLDSLDAALKALIGRMYTGEVKQNGDYRNLYIDGETPQSELPADLDAPAAEPSDDDGDIPF